MNGKAIAVIEKPIVVMRDVGQREVAVAEEAQRHQRLAGVAGLPPEEHAEDDEAGGDQQRHRDEPGDRAPVVGLALLDAEDEQEHADRRERDADPVEGVAVGLEPGHEAGGEDEARRCRPAR